MKGRTYNTHATAPVLSTSGGVLSLRGGSTVSGAGVACVTKGTKAGIGVEGGLGSIVPVVVSLPFGTVSLDSRFSKERAGGFSGVVTGCLRSSLGRGLASGMGSRFFGRQEVMKSESGVSSNTCLRTMGPFSVSSIYDKVSSSLWRRKQRQ